MFKILILALVLLELIKKILFEFALTLQVKNINCVFIPKKEKQRESVSLGLETAHVIVSLKTF